jgi:uncharacterized RDD family membrane protein YckC
MEIMLPHSSKDPLRPRGDPPPASGLFDKHSIETPEQMRLELPLAGIGSRFLAITIDSLLQAAAAVVTGIAAAFLLPALALGGARFSQVWVIAIAAFGFFLLFFGYFAIFEIVWNGQTPGKRIIGIRVIKDSGRSLTAAESIGRNLLRIVDQLPGFYAIGMLVALLNAQNKRLGDLVAGSIVVRESSSAASSPAFLATRTRAARTTADAPVATPGASTMSLDDLALIDTFLNRRHDLAPDVRSRMAARIIEQLRTRLVFTQYPGVTDEALLEALVYERRSSGGI